MKLRELLALAAAEVSPKTKIYLVIGIAAIVLFAVLGGAGVSWLKIRALERDVRIANEQADNKEAIADAKEKDSEKFREENSRLETSLAEIQKLARKQDEQIAEFEKTSVSDARRSSADARSIRALESTGDQLCGKLEELGHGCN